MKLNGEIIPTEYYYNSPQDPVNEDKLMKYIAYKMKTLPEYLFILPKQKITEDADIITGGNDYTKFDTSKITVFDIYKIIINLDYQDPYPKYIDDQNIFDKISKLWAIYFQAEIDPDTLEALAIEWESIFQQKNEYINSEYIEDIEEIQEEIAKFLENSDFDLEKFDIDNSSLVIKDQTFSINISDIGYTDLHEIFNDLKLNSNYQLALYKNLSKIHKSLQDSIDINFNTFDKISIYSIKNQNDKIKPPKITIQKNQNVTMIHVNDKNSNNEEAILKEIKTILPTLPDIPIETIYTSNISATIEFPVLICKYVLLDLFLNDNNAPFNRFSVNDSTFTKKMYSMYTYYRSPTNSKVIATIKQICTKNDNKPTIANSKHVLRVDISKSPNKLAILDFLTDFDKILKMYPEKESELVLKYQAYGVNINVQNFNTSQFDICKFEKGYNEKEFLATEIPYLFKPEPIKQKILNNDFRTVENLKGTDYLSLCATRPQIITEQEAKLINDMRKIRIKLLKETLLTETENSNRKKLEDEIANLENNKSVIKYPEVEVIVPKRDDIPDSVSNIIKPRWYSCELGNKYIRDNLKVFRNASPEDLARLKLSTEIISNDDLLNKHLLENPDHMSVILEFIYKKSPKTISQRVKEGHLTKSVISLRDNPITPNTGLKLPCCYSRPNVKSKQGEKSTNFITREKMTNLNQAGALPEDLLYILKNGYRNSKNPDFFRTGAVEIMDDVNSTLTKDDVSDSILKCLNIVTKQNPPINRDDPKIIESIPICKQSLPNMTVEEIIETYFKQDSTEYLDPFYFIRLFEIVFKVKLFIFRKDTIETATNKKDDQVTMVIPNFLGNLYINDYNLDKKAVILYEHRGGSVTPFFTCEIIGLKVSGEPSKFLFTEKSFIGALLNSENYCFKSLTLGQSKKLEIVKKNNLNYGPLKLHKQYIDMYGKTRQLEVSVLGKEGTFIINLLKPIEPLVLQVVDKELISENLNLAELKNLLEGSVIKNNRLYGKFLESEEFAYYVETAIEEKDSELTKFRNLHRLSICLKSLYIWQFSKFINEKGFTVNEGLANITLFFSEYISSIENFNDFNYTLIKPFLSIATNPAFFQDAKLKLTPELNEKLEYYLRVRCKFDKQIISYKDRTIVENYFDFLDNYKSMDDQVITPIFEDTVDYATNIKIYKIQKWLEEITNKPFTDKYENTMLFGSKILEAISILFPKAKYEVRYTNSDMDIAPERAKITRLNVDQINKALNNNKINFNPKKFLGVKSVLNYTNEIYNALQNLQMNFVNIPTFKNINISRKIEYNDKYKINKDLLLQKNGPYFIKNKFFENSVHLCINSNNLKDTLNYSKYYSINNYLEIPIEKDYTKYNNALDFVYMIKSGEYIVKTLEGEEPTLTIGRLSEEETTSIIKI